jgi:catechol 2,3-dioxygenase-like lactoylglutathione lyase family enzyme
MNLEHANVTVSDIEEATRFLQVAFPSAKVRGGGPRVAGGFWRHIGSDDNYIALQQEEQATVSNRTTYTDVGINHLGFVVNDVNGVVNRLNAAGYQGNDMGVEEGGRTSVYYYDKTGNEWEFVEYHSDITNIKNNYEGAVL